MIVKVSFSKEVLSYFKNYDLDKICDLLLETFDITNLPPCELPRYTYRTINVNNENFISLSNSLGPWSKKLSLSRLFEFAYNLDFLSEGDYSSYLLSEKSVNAAPSVNQQLDKIYRLLLEIKKYDSSEELQSIISMVYLYMKLKKVKND